MSYRNTFIQIAPDSPALSGVVPVSDRNPTPVHIVQYELLSQNPYCYTHEDLVFEVYVRRQGFSSEELAVHGATIRDELFQKGHPCLRASALTKQYGWGAHYNQEGKIALYAVDSDEYGEFVATCPNLLTALKRKR